MFWGPLGPSELRQPTHTHEMKWTLFFAAALASYPFGVVLRGSLRLQHIAWTVMGMLPFTVLGWFDINIASFETYRGDSRGFEITIADLLIVSLWVALPTGPRRSPYRAARFLYLAVALASVVGAAEPLFAWFSIWKLLRMYFILAVVSRACADPRVPPALLRGMALGVLWQLGAVVFERYGLGVHQASGLFAHQNSLATAVNLVAPVFLAMVLASPKSRLYAAALAAAAICIVLSLSRGGIAIFVLVTSLVFLVSTGRSFAPRKMAIAAVGIALAGAVLLKAGDTILDRYLTAPEASAESRVVFEDAAVLMLKDHPFGIGMNQFSRVIRQEGYGEKAEGSKDRLLLENTEYGAVAHNMYWLTAAELGYPGVIAFGFVLLHPLLLALRSGWRARGDPRGDVLLALAVALLGLYLHGLLEWTFFQTSIAYLFWMQAAIVAALARQLEVRPSTGQQRIAANRTPSALLAPTQRLARSSAR